MKLVGERKPNEKNEVSEEDPKTALAQAIYQGQIEYVKQALVQNPELLDLPEFSSNDNFRDHVFTHKVSYPFIALVKCLLRHQSKSKEYQDLFNFLVGKMPLKILECFSGKNNLFIKLMYSSYLDQNKIKEMIITLAAIPGFAQIMNTPDHEGQMALSAAIDNRNFEVEIVIAIIKCGANPLLLDNYGQNALHCFAIRDNAYQGKLFPVLKPLFENTDAINQISRGGKSPLHALLRRSVYLKWFSLVDSSYTKDQLLSGTMSCNRVLVRELLEMGADPNYLQHGISVLHLAAAAGDCDLVQLFLSYKADVSLLSSLGLTAIDFLPDVTEKNQQRVQESRALLISAGAKELDEVDKFPDNSRLDAAVELISRDKLKGRFSYLSEAKQKHFALASQQIKSSFDKRAVKTIHTTREESEQVVQNHQMITLLLLNLLKKMKSELQL